MNQPRLLDLTDNVVLITGAAGGIGTATAWACAQLGARLVLADLTPPVELQNELGVAGYVSEAAALDNTQRDEVDALLRGRPAFDAVADCSGLYLARDWTTDAEFWEQDFERLVRTNVVGPLNVVRACLPAMRERGAGRIALLGSVAAHTGGTSSDVNPAYVATKGAVHALVRYLARGLVSTGIVVNAVAPGPILTPMVKNAGHVPSAEHFPMRRLGEPAEVGWPMAFLCSPAVGYMTGTILDVNGGLYM